MRPAMPRNPGRIPAAWWHRPRRHGKASTVATWSPTSATVAHIVKLEDRRSEDSGAIFCSGGHGPICDLVGDPNSIVLIESFYTSGEPVTAACHAPAVPHQFSETAYLLSEARGRGLLPPPEAGRRGRFFRAGPDFASTGGSVQPRGRHQTRG
jgi:hypothetical protein